MVFKQTQPFSLFEWEKYTCPLPNPRNNERKPNERKLLKRKERDEMSIARIRIFTAKVRKRS